MALINFEDLPSTATPLNANNLNNNFNYCVPTGGIVEYAGTTAPNGWLLCDGSAISRTTYADLFEVIPKTDYPHDYLECTQVAKKELKNKTRPELEKTLTDISSYDVIYIGFPIWWGTLPMAMWTQLEKLDFTGKIIKPFVTHEGSKFGKSLKDLKKLCKGAEIKKGFEISGSNVENATCMVEIWLKE